MKNIMLIYPPAGRYQRGEDRCQIDTNASIANNLRACNDLGCAAALLKSKYNIFLKDYPAENACFYDFLDDLNTFKPDVILISTTNGSIFDDINIINSIKSTVKSNTAAILKGALFFNPMPELFNKLDLKNIDYLIGGEIEFIADKLIDAHFEDKNRLCNIPGISYKKQGIWQINTLKEFNSDLDSLPFPDRSLMNNKLYINPLTNRPMAVISASRGCPSNCIYCLSPVISGKKVRFRSAENIFEEIKECFYKYNISDFFFKADTFTINKQLVSGLCRLIINSELNNKITWAANSRVDTIDEDMLKTMKQAGCNLIAFGFESGSNDSLAKMKKGITVSDNKHAALLAKKAGLKIFGFYLIGFPWETKKHLEETKKLMFEIDADFIEVSILVPFKGSPICSMLRREYSADALGADSFKNIVQGTDFLSKNDLETFRKKTILEYHLRFSFIFKKIFSRELTLPLLRNYIIYGFRLLKNLLRAKS